PSWRGEGGVPAAGGAAATVAPPAPDGPPPPAVSGAGAQPRGGSVAAGAPAREPPQARRGLHLHNLGGEVDSREEQLADLRDRAVAVRQAPLVERLSEQVADHAQRAFQAEVVRRAPPGAGHGQPPPVGVDEREVGLPVATVDREHERLAHPPGSRDANWGRCSRPASSSSSVRRSACGAWPTSGCVSSALYTSSRSPATAACAASRS